MPDEPSRSVEAAVRDVLIRINALGFAVRCEGDGREVTFTATHRQAGHFFACTGPAGAEYDTVCRLGEMCGLTEFGE